MSRDGDLAEPEQAPNDLRIELKRRAYAFDIRGRDHIHFVGLTFRGQSILTDGDTDHVLYERNRF